MGQSSPKPGMPTSSDILVFVRPIGHPKIRSAFKAHAVMWKHMIRRVIGNDQ
jgi:hypothetical protein